MKKVVFTELINEINIACENHDYSKIVEIERQINEIDEFHKNEIELTDVRKKIIDTKNSIENFSTYEKLKRDLFEKFLNDGLDDQEAVDLAEELAFSNIYNQDNRK